MELNYRSANLSDAEQLKMLAINSWSQFKNDLTPEFWKELYTNLSNKNTFTTLIENSKSFVCETTSKEIVGMAFLVSSGNPTDIYDTNWSYIRYVSVNPKYRGYGIGRKLTQKCIDYAKENNERYIALHTSIMMINARHLYENLGFKILNELEPRLGKQYWLYLLNLEK